MNSQHKSKSGNHSWTMPDQSVTSGTGPNPDAGMLMPDLSS
jgi:hypothetical protein